MGRNQYNQLFLFVFPIMSACLTYELGIRIFELIGRIQHEYGVSKEEAQNQVKLFMDDFSKNKTH